MDMKHPHELMRLTEDQIAERRKFEQKIMALSDDEATEVAKGIWSEINGRNLQENIEPTKTRASLVMNKGRVHRVTEVQLRKL